MHNLIIFPGKNCSLKRYKSYFKNFNLTEIQENDDPKVILCHSIGLVNAIKYCSEREIYPFIICMDGSAVNQKIDEKFHIIMFRPITRKCDDEEWCKEVYYYDLNENIRHYPYMDKYIRDKIISKIKSM